MHNSTTRPSNNCYYVAGILLMVLAWQVLSMCYKQFLVPSPLETLKALLVIFKSGELKDNLLFTFRRQILGLSTGIVIGLVSGLTAGYFRRLGLLMQPLINFLLAVPAIIFVTMAMVWFGMGTKMTTFLVALLVFPVMHTNAEQGVRSIDKDLMEMVRVYGLPRILTIRKIYLSGIRNYLIIGFSLSLASSVRLTIMAELLGAREGMGQRIAIARAYLETEQLFAWIIVLLTILVILEYLFIRPLKRWTSRVQH